MRGPPRRRARGRRLLVLLCAITLAPVTGCQSFENQDGINQVELTRKWFTPVSIAGDFSLFNGMPALGGGAVVVAVPGGMVAIDTTTGRQRWRTTIANTIQTPQGTVAIGDSVACLTDPAAIGCVALSTGQLLWRDLNDSVGPGGPSTTDATTLYYGEVHTVAARSLIDGQVRWTTDIAPQATFHSGPAGISIRGDTVYVSAVRKLDSTRHSLRGDLVALDARDGRILWTYTVDPAPGNLRTELWAPPVLTGNLAIVGELDGAWLIAVDVRTGLEVWRTKSDTSGYIQSLTTPTVIGDTVFAGSSDTQFYAVDLHTGQLLWRTGVAFSIRSASICGDAAVLVPMGGGNLWTVNRATHEPARSGMTESGDDAESEIAMSGTTGYFMSMRGVYAFQCGSTGR